MVWSRRRMIMAGLVGALLAAIITVIALNFVGGEKQIQRKLEHRYTIDDPQFRRELGILLGPPIVDGNRVTNLENGIEIFPAMLDAVKAARHNINFETYIYWSGDIGRAVRRGAGRTCAHRRRGAGADRLGRQPEDGAGAARPDGRGRGERGALSPAALVSPGAHEQPHPPQAADRRRRGRLHGRCRHCGQLGRQRDGARSLARFALPARRAGRRADAGGVHGQLDQDDRHGAAGEGVLPPADRGGGCTGAGIHQLTEWRRRQHAAHVPAVDHGRRAARSTCPRPISSPTT